MGLIALSDAVDVPFPRRLFAALASHAVSHGQNEECWRQLSLKFQGGGSYLELLELHEDELVAFKQGVHLLIEHMNGLTEFAGFDAAEVGDTLRRIDTFLQN